MTKITLNSGTFSHEEGAVKVDGTLSVTENKAINNINGNVTSDGTVLGCFDAWGGGDNLQLHLHPANVSQAAALAETVQVVIAAVEASL